MATIGQRPFALLRIPSLVRQGLNITQIVGTLKDWGHGYRTQTMFQDVHAYKGFMDREYLFKDAPGSLIPTTDMMVETPLRRVENYRVFGEQHVYNTLTHEYEDRMMSMYTDDLESLEEMEEWYIEEKEAYKYKPEEIVEDITWLGVQHNKGFPY